MLETGRSYDEPLRQSRPQQHERDPQRALVRDLLAVGPRVGAADASLAHHVPVVAEQDHDRPLGEPGLTERREQAPELLVEVAHRLVVVTPVVGRHVAREARREELLVAAPGIEGFDPLWIGLVGKMGRGVAEPEQERAGLGGLAVQELQGVVREDLLREAGDALVRVGDPVDDSGSR